MGGVSNYEKRSTNSMPLISSDNFGFLLLPQVLDELQRIQQIDNARRLLLECSPIYAMLRSYDKICYIALRTITDICRALKQLEYTINDYIQADLVVKGDLRVFTDMKIPLVINTNFHLDEL